MQLKISVITPSYNQGNYIEETIKSVMLQKYNNYEHIIIDGCSKDKTISILNKYPHLNWISEKDNGQSDALNKGFKKAIGDIISWINSDDSLCENAFDIVNEFFVNNPHENIIVGGLNLINENGCRIEYKKPIVLNKENLINKLGSVQQQSTFFRRSLLEKVGYIDETLQCCMDHDLFARFIISGFKFNYVDKALANFRMYKDNKTAKMERIFIKEKFRTKKKYGKKSLNLRALFYMYRYCVVLPIKRNTRIYNIYTIMKSKYLNKINKCDKEFCNKKSRLS